MRKIGKIFSLINGLSKFGLSEDLKTSLHELRKLYNNAKHSPTYKTSTDKILEILKETISCLKEIKEKNLGFDPIVNTYRRTVWIAGWDHYTTGDTEVHIMIPYDGDRYIPSIDYFNITWSGWDEIINKFVSTEELLMGKEYFPRKVYSDLESERDFVDAGVFKGDYKTLVLELSKYVDEKNEKSLLPFFKEGIIPGLCFMESFMQFVRLLMKKDSEETILKNSENQYNFWLVINMLVREIQKLFKNI